jgi:glycosyltransferase involved in cell wall biosynthesis
VKIAFITNLPSHFHTRTFETIARHYDTDFLFFSDCSEPWIEKKNEFRFGNYEGAYVQGSRITSRLRINTALVRRLVRGNYDLIIQSINGRFELPASFLTAKTLKKPFILWTNLWFHPQTLFHRFSFPITKYIYRHADAIIAYGYHVRDYLTRLGVDEKKVFYSWNVADNDLFNKPIPGEVLESLRSRYCLHGRRPILFVGRLSREKGLNYLLEAYKDLPVELNASLILVGEGEEKARLVDLVEINQLNHVHFAGYVPNHELAPYYAVAEVLVLPSITTKTLKEVWGIVLNEAMNQGCPVIATNAVGAAVGGLVQEGKNGVIVPERNSLALRDAIVRLLADPKKLREMRAYAKKWIQQWDHHKSFEGFQQAIEFASSKRCALNKKD